MNNDLISRSKAIEELQYLKLINYDNSGFSKIHNNAIQKCIEEIDNAPSVTPDMAQVLAYESGKASAERPQGEWKHYEEYTNDRPFYITECPFCKLRVQEETNFCPNCGSQMQKGGAE